jgi:hypothetical protein
MKGCTANAEVRHRFDQSGDADATRDLSDNFGSLRHFSDYIGSNCLICRLNAGCAIWSVLAACRKLPARAISAKDTDCRRSKE